jgi:hypothetical protein
MGLSDHVMSELLGQYTNTDPFPHTSSLSMPVGILCSTIRQSSYAYKSVKTKFQKPTHTFRIHKLIIECKLSDSRILSNQKDSSGTVPVHLIQQDRISDIQNARHKVYRFSPDSTSFHTQVPVKITSPTQLSRRRNGKSQQHSQVPETTIELKTL